MEWLMDCCMSAKIYNAVLPARLRPSAAKRYAYRVFLLLDLKHVAILECPLDDIRLLAGALDVL